MRLRNLAIVMLMSVATAGCVSMGSNYSSDAVAKLKARMSKAEVIALLGKPTSTVTMSGGQQQLMWVRSRGTMIGTATGRSLLLMFAADGTYSGQATQAETDIR
jgi:hypothetical protein